MATSTAETAAAPPPLRPRHVLSLGSDCFCRVLASSLGYLRRKAEGYESGPFDIAYTSHRAVCELLRSDFEGFMEPGALSVTAPALPCCPLLAQLLAQPLPWWHSLCSLNPELPACILERSRPWRAKRAVSAARRSWRSSPG